MTEQLLVCKEITKSSEGFAGNALYLMGIRAKKFLSWEKNFFAARSVPISIGKLTERDQKNVKNRIFTVVTFDDSKITKASRFRRIVLRHRGENAWFATFDD